MCMWRRRLLDLCERRRDGAERARQGRSEAHGARTRTGRKGGGCHGTPRHLVIIILAVALRLCATMCLPHDCQCGQTIDALGLHCFSCLKNSGKHTQHSILNDIVW